mgnify:CR=1 FL=1
MQHGHLGLQLAGGKAFDDAAVLHDDGESVTLFFTAAGRRDLPQSFEQRLFASSGRLGQDGVVAGREAGVLDARATVGR